MSTPSALVLFAVLATIQPAVTVARQKHAGEAVTPRCFLLELYVSSYDKSSLSAKPQIEAFAAKNAGYLLHLYDTEKDPKADDRVDFICRRFKVKRPAALVYGGGKLIVAFDDKEAVERKLESLATMTVYVRAGCPRCEKAKAFLLEFVAEYPALRLRLRDIVTDPAANSELQSLVRDKQTAAASVPVFHVVDQISVGFISSDATGNRLREILARWTTPCSPAERDKPKPSPSRKATGGDYRYSGVLSMLISIVAADASEESDSPPPAELPLPDEEGEISEVLADDEQIDLPLFGPLNVRRVGLPLFTLAVGLVDGFNPCAMWVLLFLLSVLVNLHSRWKILAVAGTFIVISAAAYFAFMAAWFSVFQLVGLLRGVQVFLALIAITIGLIHINSSFQFSKLA